MEPVRLAVIGAGLIGAKHAKLVEACEECVFVGVADADPRRRAVARVHERAPDDQVEAHGGAPGAALPRLDRQDDVGRVDRGVQHGLPRDGDPAGHQEIYLVLDGAARFTVDGETFDVRKGGIVFLEDPALRRQAVALEAGTVVFAVGGPAGEVFVPSPWEDEFYEQGRSETS